MSTSNTTATTANRTTVRAMRQAAHSTKTRFMVASTARPPRSLAGSYVVGLEQLCLTGVRLLSPARSSRLLTRRPWTVSDVLERPRGVDCDLTRMTLTRADPRGFLAGQPGAQHARARRRASERRVD